MSATEDAVPGRGAVKITRVSTADYEWKRARPITNGLHTYTTSDMTVVKIETDAGMTGYGVGRPRPGERELRASFLETLIGQDPTMTEAIWSGLWSPKLSGRRGYETRALSSIDMALWDIRAKVAGHAALQAAGRLPRLGSRPTSPAATTPRARASRSCSRRSSPTSRWARGRSR